ncbi:MAG: DUF4390 domain-containing protein, partial [Gammaproteobacteria bacterium]|nr:DUF4390 domain-containing protein [Gammaproteobacteria bacterium]
MNEASSDRETGVNKEVLANNNARFFIERRRRKRCPECQFFLAFALILLSSLAVSFLLNIFPSLINKGDFQIISANSFERKNNIVIDADLKMDFPDEVVEALENSIPLTIAVEIQVLRERFWWRNLIIKESTQLFELRYHPLTNVHEVKNIVTGERYTFNSRQDAMAVLGTIRAAHLIEKKELNDNRQYYVQMRILLDISRLPPALRQIASLSSSWRLESPWFRWAINDKPRSRAAMTAAESADLSVALKRKNKEPEPEPEQEQ